MRGEKRKRAVESGVGEWARQGTGGEKHYAGTQNMVQGKGGGDGVQWTVCGGKTRKKKEEGVYEKEEGPALKRGEMMGLN